MKFVPQTIRVSSSLQMLAMNAMTIPGLVALGESCAATLAINSSRFLWTCVAVLLWERNGKKQIIFEAETLAAVTAFALWRPVVAGKKCVLFVDNEGTKFSLLKGTSDNETVDLLAGFFTEFEAGVHTYSLLARVPSKCNIADPPSRNDLSMPFFDGAEDVSKDACAISNELISKIL